MELLLNNSQKKTAKTKKTWFINIQPEPHYLWKKCAQTKKPFPTADIPYDITRQFDLMKGPYCSWMVAKNRVGCCNGSCACTADEALRGKVVSCQESTPLKIWQMLGLVHVELYHPFVVLRWCPWRMIKWYTNMLPCKSNRHGGLSIGDLCQVLPVPRCP